MLSLIIQPQLIFWEKLKQKKEELGTLGCPVSLAILVPSAFTQLILDAFRKPHQLEHVLCNSLSVLPSVYFTQLP